MRVHARLHDLHHLHPLPADLAREVRHHRAQRRHLDPLRTQPRSHPDDDSRDKKQRSHRGRLAPTFHASQLHFSAAFGLHPRALPAMMRRSIPKKLWLNTI